MVQHPARPAGDGAAQGAGPGPGEKRPSASAVSGRSRLNIAANIWRSSSGRSPSTSNRSSRAIRSATPPRHDLGRSAEALAGHRVRRPDDVAAARRHRPARRRALPAATSPVSDQPQRRRRRLREQRRPFLHRHRYAPRPPGAASRRPRRARRAARTAARRPFDRRQAAGGEICSSSRAAFGRVDRPLRLAAERGERREEAAHQIGVVGEQRPQLLDGQRQRDRRPARSGSSPASAGPAIASMKPSAAGASIVADARSRPLTRHASVEQDVQASSARRLPARARCRARGAPAATRWRCGTARRPMTEAKSGRRRSRPASSAAGSGSSHSSRRRSAGIRCSASAHDAASNTYQSCDVAVRQHVLDVVGQAPHLLLADDVDRRGRDDRVVVVDQLQQRFLDVARPRLDQDVAAADPLVERHVLEHRHDPLAQRRRQDVVEVLRGARPAARVAVIERPARPRRCPPAGRAASAAGRCGCAAAPSSASSACASSESALQLAAAEQVAVQRQEGEVAPRLLDRLLLDRLARESSARDARAGAARAPTRPCSG